ncbi:TonB-dependent receptor [Aliiglaciecola sp. CAU 1673]|uniref:TonB-dependent receptor n=1 Tax=Aliiglaciecola sp. CAU 1673 TaxID=3032595 RepID=UPI0023DBF28E|nr:TonB-dependent receptor [Aliiglaciecola sp. CAU 1673]MDF2179569.1 TonB-dependent receptor [Aliiglaciecola sp. CAU 1673]
MYTQSRLSGAVRLALALGVSSALASTAFAQDATPQQEEKVFERISVTGSSIKRTDVEGSLPITNITSEDIVRSGVTSVPELISQLPSMQGFIAASQSVGGGGAGISEASLRGIGGEYTLVLLNGRRLAASGSGSAVDVNSIPIAAIERVEILNDGASSLYGSDAIAGVINFILKKDVQETTVSARYDAPQESGGDNYSFSITSGFGDLSKDGFNVFASFSRETQEILRSVDRDFSKTGFIPFNYNGNDLMFVADSSNAIPGNARVRFTDGTQLLINPYRESNGSCAANNVPSDATGAVVTQRICRFDFTSTLEIIPEYTRDNFLLGGVLELSDDAELYGTASYSIFEQIARIAPYPTGNFILPTNSALVQSEVIPHLTADQVAKIRDVAAAWRVLPGGNRTNEFATDSLFLDFGVRGEFNEISYDFNVGYSKGEREDTILTGYPITDLFLPLVASGQVNVFAHPDDLSDQERQLVKDTMYSGLDTVTTTDLFSVGANFSAPVFELPAGEVYLGGGFDYRESSYEILGSEANQEAIILFSDPNPQFDLSRNSYGAFLETIVPVIEGLEVTGSVRYDEISGIDNVDVDTGVESKIGVDMDDTTYKISLAYRPNDNWLFRASTGTGFKAPTMRQIAEPRINFGVTGNVYNCPFGAGDPLTQFCRVPNSQYDVFREGNANLSPEQSKQKSLGVVFSPNNEFSFTLDWWQVNLTDEVERPTEGNIFGDPVTFRELFTTRTDLGTGEQVLAIIQGPVNVGESNNEGIDWSLDLTNELGFATLKTRLSGTYIIESESLRTGTTDVYDTSLGRKGPDDNVVFRNRVRIANTLTHGDFSHALNINYQGGYVDEYFPANDFSIRYADDLGRLYDGGVQLSIPSYTTVDYLTQYHYDKSLKVSFGINNLLDATPPLAFGENGGHQEGFDPRYFDSYGRTFYLSADYTF